MKKNLFILLPALFLLLGAAINKEENKQILKELKTELENSKEISSDNTEQKENASTITEISLEELVVLQGKKNSVVEQKIFKLNLPKREYLLLYEQLANQKKFVTTDNKNIVWDWTELSSAYFYKISVKLDEERNCLFITITPIQTNGQNTPVFAKTEKEQDDLHVSYAAFSLSREDDSIFFNGKAYGINNREFHRPILYIE